MKSSKLLKLIAIILTLVCLVSVLSSCGEKLTMKGDKFVHSKTGVVYSAIRGVYLPKAVSSDPYVVFKTDNVEIEYYSIQGLSSDEWLVSKTGDLIFAGDKTKLPELEDFGAEEMLICRNTDTLFSIIDETDKTLIKSIVDRIVNTDARTVSLYEDDEAYKMLFSSSKNPYLYYQFKLYVTEDGIYICDNTIGAFWEATDLFSSYDELAYSYSD